MTPYEIFQENIGDAEQLVRLVHMLSNGRDRRIRSELRDRLGTALALPQKTWESVEGVESDHLFVVLKPAGEASLDQFTSDGLRPLLRQAIVAMSAAVESYVADKAETYAWQALSAEELPKKLGDLPMTLGDVVELDRKYERRQWGYRARLIKYLNEKASTAPSSIGIVMSTVGISVDWAKIDRLRKVPPQSTDAQLKVLCDRRNRIAHAADRARSARAPLSVEEVETFLEQCKSIIGAMEEVLPKPTHSSDRA